MAVTYFEKIPTLTGKEARNFIEKMKKVKPVKLSSLEKALAKEIKEFSKK